MGFTPLITFNHCHHLQEVVEKIPLERILLETDSPFFLPQNTRSESGLSHPGFVIFTAKHVAKLKRIPLEKVMQAHKETVQQVYGICDDDETILHIQIEAIQEGI